MIQNNLDQVIFEEFEIDRKLILITSLTEITLSTNYETIIDDLNHHFMVKNMVFLQQCRKLVKRLDIKDICQIPKHYQRYPLAVATNELRRLNDYVSIKQFFEVISTAVQFIVVELQQYQLGADDLMPMFVYSICKAELCSVHSMKQLVDDFCCEEILKDANMYNYISFCGALDFVERLSQEMDAGEELSDDVVLVKQVMGLF